jgi:hypothetical protein
MPEPSKREADPVAAKKSFLAHEWARKRNEQKQKAEEIRRAGRAFAPARARCDAPLRC